MREVLVCIRLPDDALDRLRSVPGVRVHAAPPGRELPAGLMRGKQVLLCKTPPKSYDDLADLEFLQLATVGHEHWRHLGLADRPVRVANARGVFDPAIGEWCVSMMVNLRRDLRGMLRNQERGVWDRDGRFQQEVREGVLGLWGYGGIGRETARLAKALGMTVHVMTRTGVRPRHDAFTEPGTGDSEGELPDRVFVASQEREFLAGLDFLVLALPHTRESSGMVGEEQLRALRPTAFVLNPARGPIIQEQALLRALREGWIAGASLDTHFAYPLPPDHPLWTMPNVILTPHVAGADHSRHFPGRMTELFAQNLERFLAGRPLLNVVTPHELRES
jgi:phosphoglycerate dehydrogenase-like enzyme